MTLRYLDHFTFFQINGFILLEHSHICHFFHMYLSRLCYQLLSVKGIAIIIERRAYVACRACCTYRKSQICDFILFLYIFLDDKKQITFLEQT